MKEQSPATQDRQDWVDGTDWVDRTFWGNGVAQGNRESRANREGAGADGERPALKRALDPVGLEAARSAKPFVTNDPSLAGGKAGRDGYPWMCLH